MEQSMTVLWLINITMPDVCETIGQAIPVIGGWLCGYRDALLTAYPSIKLHIVEPYYGGKVKQLITRYGVDEVPIVHHLFPQSWLQSANVFTADTSSRLSPISNHLAVFLSDVNNEVKPDVVHLHGTEFPHSHLWIEACGTDKLLVSIQGLTSVITRYYLGGLTSAERRHCWSFNDWRFGRTLEKMQQRMQQSSRAEVAVLSQAPHIAGRTSWDKAHAWTFNPTATYHVLQEVLRDPFYHEENQWKLEHCQRHTIFMSQGHYPIKGLHRMLDALPTILRHYPDTQLYVIGSDPRAQHWRHRSEFSNILLRKLKPVGEHVHFVGFLSAEQMLKHYTQAHLFVCPSAIENSSNSVCEAQLLGCPVVASYVGGMMDLILQGETGLLYRYEETEMLAQAVCRIFSDDELAMKLGHQAHIAASQRHDRQSVANSLYSLYSDLTHGS